MHWSFEPAVISASLPPSLELDLYAGRAWVGVVPFEMKGIRPSWLPGAMALDFLETNVRTYVLHEGAPGVFFFSLEASSWLAVTAARIQWSLPYHHAAMRSRREKDRVRYSTRRRSSGALFEADYSVGRDLGPSQPGTFEHFLLERYYLFVEHRGVLFKGQVHHAPYPARDVEVHHLEDSLIAASGLPAVVGPPEVAHFSEGVDVEVFGPWPASSTQPHPGGAGAQ